MRLQADQLENRGPKLGGYRFRISSFYFTISLALFQPKKLFIAHSSSKENRSSSNSLRLGYNGSFMKESRNTRPRKETEEARRKKQCFFHSTLSVWQLQLSVQELPSK